MRESASSKQNSKNQGRKHHSGRGIVLIRADRLNLKMLNSLDSSGATRRIRTDDLLITNDSKDDHD